jgi:bifunctional oligoribonuclease and PAP phosphatase NrnA
MRCSRSKRRTSSVEAVNDCFFPDLSKRFRQWFHELRGQSVLVLGHIRPDGDCIGAQVALVRILQSAGIDAVASNAHPVPANLITFVGDTPFLAPGGIPETISSVVAVDCSSAERIGAGYQSLWSSIDCVIDHHISNEAYARVNLIDPRAAATCEMLAGIALDCGLTLDAVTAQALYVGIATDTGQFRYAQTTSRCFRIAAALVDLGANANDAAHQLYENESAARLQLLQRFLQTLTLHHEGQVALATISQSMFKETGTSREMCEGFVDYPRSIASVRIAMLIEEQNDGTIKGSLRSKHEHDRVDLLAARFQGGGHACAAGFSSELTLTEFIPTLLAVVDEHLKSLSF